MRMWWGGGGGQWGGWGRAWSVVVGVVLLVANVKVLSALESASIFHLPGGGGGRGQGLEQNQGMRDGRGKERGLASLGGVRNREFLGGEVGISGDDPPCRCEREGGGGGGWSRWGVCD